MSDWLVFILIVLWELAIGFYLGRSWALLKVESRLDDLTARVDAFQETSGIMGRALYEIAGAGEHVRAPTLRLRAQAAMDLTREILQQRRAESK